MERNRVGKMPVDRMVDRKIGVNRMGKEKTEPERVDKVVHCKVEKGKTEKRTRS
jgi:hypothetical protein